MHFKATSAACAAALLVGCAGKPVLPFDRQLPPASLLEDCPAPQLDLRTNGGLARGILDLQTALRMCNDEKAALRLWATQK